MIVTSQPHDTHCPMQTSWHWGCDGRSEPQTRAPWDTPGLSASRQQRRGLRHTQQCTPCTPLPIFPSLPGLPNPMIEETAMGGRGVQRYASCSLALQGANGVGLAPAGCRAAGAVGSGAGRAGGKQGRAGGCPGQGRAGQGGQDGRGWVRSQPCLSKSLAPRRKSGNISSSNSSGSGRRRRRAGAAEGGRRLSPRGDVEGGEAACGAGRLSASPGLRVCALLHPSLHLSLPPLSLPPARPLPPQPRTGAPAAAPRPAAMPRRC